VTPRRLRGDGFVGREAELARLAGLLDEGAILVTLVGPAGIGKSTLARKLARVHEARTGDGVALCDLAEAHGVQEVAAALAFALDVQPPHASDERQAIAHVGRTLAGRGAILVVLDCCEHLLAALRESLDAWLELAPEAQFVTTSRQPLGLSFERLVDVGPLVTPSGDRLAGDAHALWLARNGPPAAPDDPDEAVLCAILRALEGSPLAIELAAARARVLGLCETLRRLERDDDVTDSGRDAASARHASVGRAIQASWDLLDPVERTVLARCSVMRGAFSFAAAEAVVGPLDDPAGRSPSALLEALCDKSLLRPVDAGNQRRLTYWLGVRRFAEERLDDAERRSAELVHARWFGALARDDTSYGIALEGPDRHDLRAAVVRCVAAGRSEEQRRLALQILVAVDPTGWVMVPVGWHEETLAGAIEGPIEADNVALMATAFLLRGRLLGASAGAAAMESDIARAVELAAQLPEGAAVESAAYRVLAQLKIRHGLYAEGRALAERAVACARRAGDPALEALALFGMSRVVIEHGDVDEAIALNERALAVAPTVTIEGTVLLGLAFAYLNAGDGAMTRECIGRALRRPENAGWHRAMCLMALAIADDDEGNVAAAAVAYRRAIDVARTLGKFHDELMTRAYATRCAAEVALDPRAILELRQALAALRDLGPSQYLSVLDALAGTIEARAGHLVEAEALVTRAERELAGTEGPHPHAVALCRAAIRVARARETGGDDHDAIAEAERLIAVARAIPAPGGRPLTQRTFEIRAAIRSLEAVLERRRPAPSLPPPGTLLGVDREGRWFEPPDGPRVDIGRRPVMRRLLVALTQARLDAPGKPLAWRALLELGWPEERMLPTAGRNRVHVMLWRMRELGLRHTLCANEDGYWLATDVTVRFDEAR
jgi:predicted ATPase/tetratricopeptide (TPR) repeat protein